MKALLVGIHLSILLAGAAYAGALDRPAYNKTIGVQQLAQAYEENEFTADQRYKGQALAISGTIEEITKGEGDIPVVALRVSRMERVLDLRCYFANMAGFANLKAGGQINVRGVVDGMRGYHLVVKNCALVR
ncbi:MAG TPA: hypothetical protein VK474_11590 [Chthoniobacterales bacterium]|nr:hypothetical protein [Chthoniobacterales bacterium]